MHRFQFIKDCYGCLKAPNVASSHSWTPDKVKNLYIAGDLYVRAFKPLVIEDEPPKHDEQASTSTQDSASTARSYNSPVVTHSAQEGDDDINQVSFYCAVVIVDVQFLALTLSSCYVTMLTCRWLSVICLKFQLGFTVGPL